MKILKPIVSFLILIFLIALNEWLSLHFGFKEDYLQFYLNKGSLIGLVTAVVVISWGDLNKNIGLISPNPYTYLSACRRVIYLPLEVLSKGWNEVSEKWDIITKGIKYGGVAFPLKDYWIFWDLLFGVLLGVIIVLSLLIWLVVVAPLQYFIFLLAGALPRIFGIFLTEKAIATLQNGRLIIEWIKKDKSIPEGWWDASFSQKPVVVTAVISSLILWILKLAIT
jgi:hypothetical protein